jgi:hypothetical protein
MTRLTMGGASQRANSSVRFCSELQPRLVRPSWKRKAFSSTFWLLPRDRQDHSTLRAVMISRVEQRMLGCQSLCDVHTHNVDDFQLGV